MDEVQYCVILNQGDDKGLKQYFWVSRECAEKVFHTFQYNPLFECHRDGWYGNSVITDSGAKAEFMGFRKSGKDVKGNFIGSLEIEVEDEVQANKIADDFKLPIPFPNVKYK